MAMVFTCKKCDTRAAKTFSRHSYENGIVVVRCPGCQSLHLVADNLGWFEHGSKGFRIEDLLRQRGEGVLRLSDAAAPGSGGGGSSNGGGTGGDAAALSAEDVAGWSKVQDLIHATAGQGGSGSGDEPAAVAAGAGEGGSGAGGVISVAPSDLDAWARVKAAAGPERGGGDGRGPGQGRGNSD